jgi:putative phage-type endonuclease
MIQINDTEYNDLQNSINDLHNNFLHENYLIYHEENYSTIIFQYIKEMLVSQLEPLYDEYYTDHELVDIFIDSVINVTIRENKFNILERSQESVSNINNINNDTILEKINLLDTHIPQIQNTDEWFEARHKYLTASSMWKVFSTPGSYNSLIYNKCLNCRIQNKNVNTNSSLHWGHKYEPLSTMYYEHRYNTTIKEYGCIPHKTISHIAASPDGINYDINSGRYGRMLEIKNIVNRKITGIPKKEYWIQVQIQMEVCDLNECDFLETQFVEYDNEDEFTKDGTFNLTNDNKLKGIIIMFIDCNNNPVYEYAPININKEEFDEFEKQIICNKLKENCKWFSSLYWKLENVSCVLVKRNQNWFNSAKVNIENAWNIILKEKKNNSYISRAPKKKKKLNNSYTNICKIDINNL